ncbi:DUF4142 domain-containing protein [Azospirillum thermophilum]|uniref:DUF4142 domain-containing protein n=1 Tax=Azospirillum thermophilum TaxID=2202148 RepID=A0A2S2CRG1_9PROT|nr:DUF4142 domain-containing protein [Azospirillum thermophilum]AWK87066.1 hypothetical protein DEW08_13265 [Azospirillum thermophilum]
MNKRFALAAAIAATVLSTPALAQSQFDPDRATGPAKGLPVTDTPTAGKVFVLGEDVAQLGSARDFVTQAASSGFFEVESSRLALDRSQSDQVRSFARQMIEDHTRVNQQLATLSRAQGIEPPMQPDATFQQKLTQLQGLSGNSFDRMYLNEQVTAHKQAVNLFATAANSTAADMAPYQAFAAQTLPVLRHHLQEAEALAGTGMPTAAR